MENNYNNEYDNEFKQIRKKHMKEEKRKNRNSDSKNNRKKVKKRKTAKKIFKLLIVLAVILVICVIGLIIGIASGTDKLTKEDLVFKNLTTFIYDKNGNEYATIHGGENRIVAKLKDMSPYLPKAFIAIEDERFETHFGIDIKRTGKAVLTWVTNSGSSSFGGSTITQQLVKNITDDKASKGIDGVMRKIREWVRAVQVETWLTKDEIMEMYLNIIYLGDGAYGVQTASYTYFGKDVKDLTLAECAVIAGVTHAPEAYDYNKNPEKLKNRQETVLAKMLSLGMITQEEHDEAVNQKLEFRSESTTTVTSYITEAIIEEVIKDIQVEKNTTRAVASKMVYSDGLKIYTNIDPKVQSAMEKVYRDNSYFPLDSAYNERPQSAMVVMDYKTGSVVGLVGGAGEKVVQRGLNRATDSARQPGSTIKPIAVYGPGIDIKKITAGTVYDDVYTNFNGYDPGNWTGGYAGLSTVRKGIEKSMNIVAVKALRDIGVKTGYNYLTKMGISTLTTKDQSLSLALGGLTNGIIPIEMCGAYATIANGGTYIEPSLYKKVIDKNGNVLIENKQETQRVFSQQTAYIVLDMMRDVVRGSNGTATYINIGGNPVAAKTGSTDSNKDRWFCGISPYYVGTVWYGFDQPKRVRVSGQNPAAKIWNAVMKEVHSGLAVSSFNKPSGINTVTICTDSGKLAGPLCSSDQRGNRTRSELYISGTEPTYTCDVHVSVTICGESGLLATDNCPNESKVTQVFIQRKVKDANVSTAADYKYEAPTTSCNVHSKIHIPDEPIIKDPIIDDEDDNKEDIDNTGSQGYVTD